MGISSVVGLLVSTIIGLLVSSIIGLLVSIRCSLTIRIYPIVAVISYSFRVRTILVIAWSAIRAIENKEHNACDNVHIGNHSNEH